MSSTLQLRANGKLMLFGEYAVLDGCTAIAWPTRFGQSLEVTSEQLMVTGLYWKSLNHKGEVWFEAYFDEDFNLLHELQNEVALTLQKILLQARKINPDFLLDGLYHEASIEADYPTEWGLGSSSTLIYLIASWAGVNALDLFFNTLSGSGYDVICAGTETPIEYRKTSLKKAEWAPLDWDFSILDSGVFVYLGTKQSSREGILHYMNRGFDKKELAKTLDEAIETLLREADPPTLSETMKISETLLSEALKMDKVQDLYFSDFPGTVKSLGAWGGDFVFALPDIPEYDAMAYFQAKGYEVLFRPEEILL